MRDANCPDSNHSRTRSLAAPTVNTLSANAMPTVGARNLYLLLRILVRKVSSAVCHSSRADISLKSGADGASSGSGASSTTGVASSRRSSPSPSILRGSGGTPCNSRSNTVWKRTGGSRCVITRPAAIHPATASAPLSMTARCTKVGFGTASISRAKSTSASSAGSSSGGNAMRSSCDASGASSTAPCDDGARQRRPHIQHEIEDHLIGFGHDQTARIHALCDSGLDSSAVNDAGPLHEFDDADAWRQRRALRDDIATPRQPQRDTKYFPRIGRQRGHNRIKMVFLTEVNSR